MNWVGEWGKKFVLKTVDGFPHLGSEWALLAVAALRSRCHEKLHLPANKIYALLQILIVSHLVVSKPRVIASSEAPANLKVEVQKTNATCKSWKTNHSPILAHQVTVEIPHLQLLPTYFVYLVSQHT